LSTKKRTVHYVCSSHWDREWYQTFQDYRYRLVNMMDDLLDTMERDPRFRYFQADGQTIVLEDYLEIRPEREEQIRKLVQEGRLRIGPWYVLPDLFIPCGESLVRNLQTGVEISKKFGKVMRAGFCCDLFGQNSQLPQIFRNFSLDNAQFFRGSSEEKHGAMFRWEGADGSELLVYRFGPIAGYATWSKFVRHAFTLEKNFDLEESMEGVHRYLEDQKARIPTPSMIAFDGVDHMEIEHQIPELIEKINKVYDDVEVIFSHMEGFAEDLREQREYIKNHDKGELRAGCPMDDHGIVVQDVVSSRIHLKQENARCENELCLWAEPFSAFAQPMGFDYPHGFLHTAWKWLIKNHPHDSICGCSIDQVHKDMEFRFDQCRMIAEKQSETALGYIARHVDNPELGEKNSSVVIFNPTGNEIDGPVDVTLTFPAEIEETWYDGLSPYDPKVSFKLYDPQNNELPYQLINQRWNRQHYYRPWHKIPIEERRHEIDVTVNAKIPAFGYTTLTCKPVKKGIPTRYLDSMLTDDHTMENEHLQVTVQPNGTLKMVDKDTGENYENLLTFEDMADIGDGWCHGVAVNDQIFTSSSASANVARVADGINKATLKIVTTMDLPKQFDFNTMVRSEETATLRITNYVTLRRNARKVEIKSVVENNVRDHRLRVLMPTGTKADTYFSDTPFDVVERDIKLPEGYEKKQELDEETNPNYTWTAVYDQSPAKRGLAVLSTGLPESAVRDKPNRPIALTLLRGFKRTVLTDGEEGGQILGTHEFNYAILPLQGELPRADLCRMGQQLAAAPRTVQVEPRDLKFYKSGKILPLTHGFITIPPQQAVITAVHRRENTEGIIVRMFNPFEEEITETLELTGDVSSAELIDLEGNSQGPAKLSGKTVNLTLKPKKIVTLQVK